MDLKAQLQLAVLLKSFSGYLHAWLDAGGLPCGAELTPPPHVGPLPCRNLVLFAVLIVNFHHPLATFDKSVQNRIFFTRNYIK